MKEVRFEDFPKLGFGIMRVPELPGDEKKFDEEAFKEMLDTYMAAGMNYFDTAHVYYNGESERLLAKYLTSRYDRDSFYIADKLPIWAVKEKDDLEKLFNESLERCQTDYFDLYLLHCLNVANAEKVDEFGAYDYVKQLKKEGKVKKIGFSFHDTPELLEKLLEKYPEMDFVQLQINYLDWNGSMQSSEFYRLARKYNKPIIVMEPVRGGALANLGPDIEKIFKDFCPEKSVASWALRFSSSLDGVITTLSGMSNMEQMKDNINTYTDFQYLSEKEKEIINQVNEKIAEMKFITCTGCRYCANCPQKIDISGQFKLYNDYIRNLVPEASAMNKFMAYETKADSCLRCSKCENVCPQKLNVVEILGQVQKELTLYV